MFPSPHAHLRAAHSRSLGRSRAVVALFLAAFTFLSAGLGVAETASAGTFHAYACQRPDGRAIPATDWSFERSSTTNPLGEDHCATAGFAELRFGETPTAAGDWTGYGLTLPDGLKASFLIMYRWHQMRDPGSGADAGAHPAYDFSYGQTTRWYHPATTIPDWCYAPNCKGYAWPNVSTTGTARVVADFPGGASFLGFSLRCRTATGGTGGTCAGRSDGRALARILGLDAIIRDDVAPTASDPSGSLTESGPRSGIQSLSYAGSDVGGGVYYAVLEVDGTEVRRYRPDPSPSCTDSGYLPGSPYEFDRVQPCSRSLGVRFDLDTVGLAAGAHRATTYLLDAGGNPSNVLTQNFTVDNGAARIGPPNGTGGQPETGRLGLDDEKKELKAKYNAAKVAISGKLVDANGTPIAGATLDVSEQLAVPAAAFTKIGSVTTAIDGRYRFAPKTTATRRVRLSFAERQGSTEYRAMREVLVSITAGMSITAKPSVVARKGLIRLAGKVRLDALPASGTWVEVQVLQAKSWRTIATRRVSRTGGWVFKHRLKSAARTTLAFRSRLRPASDVPSAQAKSRPVKVRVR